MSLEPPSISATRPLRILVSYSMDASAVNQEYADELHGLAQSAARTLTRAADDVQVVFVDATHPYRTANELISAFDGVLILGGADVDPSLYTSDRAAISQAQGVDRSADDFEIALVHEARDAGKPLFGICRGLQIINVALGGTLIPDLGEGRVHNDHPVTSTMSDHDVHIAEGSTLERVLSSATIPIRSAHHQAIEEAAACLSITAHADDGVIEAVESPNDYWTVAVQWHPEDPGAREDDFMALSLAFIQAARERRDDLANNQ